VSARRRTVTPAAWIFLVSRAAVAVLAATVVVGFEESANPERNRWDSPRLHELGAVVDVWARWDSDWYLRIAESGYSWPSSTPAFFPLYPLGVSATGRLLFDHYVLGAVILSLASGLLAFVLLHRLTELRLGRRNATWTIVFLAVSPTALFFGAAYSESLFLLLAVASFLSAERGRFGIAGAAAGLAMLTRPVGVALVPALILFAWRSGERPRALAGAMIAPIVALAYPLVLWLWIGRPLAFLDAQEVVWGRSLSPKGPFEGIASAVGGGHVVDLAVAVAVLAGAVLAWRLLGAPYGAYALACVGVPLAFAGDDPLLSIQRLALVAFPVYMVLGHALSGHRARLVVATVLAAWGALYVVRWALWYWVA
jgi:hypothetical protein